MYDSSEIIQSFKVLPANNPAICDLPTCYNNNLIIEALSYLNFPNQLYLDKPCFFVSTKKS